MKSRLTGVDDIMEALLVEFIKIELLFESLYKSKPHFLKTHNSQNNNFKFCRRDLNQIHLLPSELCSCLDVVSQP